MFLSCKQNPVLYKKLSFMDEIMVLSSGCGGQRIKKKKNICKCFFSISHLPKEQLNLLLWNNGQCSCVFMVLMVKMLLMVNRSSRIVSA